MTIASEVFLAVLNSLWQAAIVAGLVWVALASLEESTPLPAMPSGGPRWLWSSRSPLRRA